MVNFPKLKNKYVLAPMAEVTTLPFRSLCREYGASLAYTEQINAMALLRANRKTKNMGRTCKEDSPLALQLSGNDPKTLLQAAKKAKKYVILDINMGCPSKKIVKSGFGSALLNEKERIKNLISYLVKNLKVPVTVKMRSGFKKNEAVEIAKIIEEAGASAIAIHARTQSQGYSGSADWNVIRELKKAVKIPIIGNGDIDSPEKAMQMLKETGCDYVMIGRAAIKNPAIFKQCVDYENKGKYKEENKVKMLKRYLYLCKKYKVRAYNLKMIATNFLKGMENGSIARNDISRAKTDKEIVQIFNKFYKIRK